MSEEKKNNTEEVQYVTLNRTSTETYGKGSFFIRNVKRINGCGPQEEDRVLNFTNIKRLGTDLHICDLIHEDGANFIVHLPKVTDVPETETGKPFLCIFSVHTKRSQGHVGPEVPTTVSITFSKSPGSTEEKS
jgi:hypothetical protein